MHTCNEIMKIQYVEIHSFNSNRLIVRRPNSQPVHTTKIFFCYTHLETLKSTIQMKLLTYSTNKNYNPTHKIYDGLNC